MKSINFSNPGRLGFTQGDLDFMQQGNAETALVFASLGGGYAYYNPVIISGMVLTGTTLSAGTFAFNGQLYTCAGGDTGMYPGGGNSFVVSLTETVVDRPYRNGTTAGVRSSVVGVFRIMANADIVSDNDFLVTAFDRFVRKMGATAREEWSELLVVSAGAGDVNGSIYYKKDIIANTLSMRWTLNVDDAQSLDPALTASFTDLATLPVGSRPADPQYITAHRGSSGMMRDYDNYGLLKQFTGKIGIDGVIAIEFVKPAAAISGYSVSGNCVVLLD